MTGIPGFDPSKYRWLQLHLPTLATHFPEFPRSFRICWNHLPRVQQPGTNGPRHGSRNKRPLFQRKVQVLCNLLHVAIFAGEISHLHPSVLNKIHSFRKVAETNKLAHHIPQFFIFPSFFPNIPHIFPINFHHGITSRQRINGRGGFSAALSFPSLVGAELCSPRRGPRRAPRGLWLTHLT